MSSCGAGAPSFNTTSPVGSRVATTWQTLKKFLLNQTKPIGRETVFREAEPGCACCHRRSSPSDGGVAGGDGSVPGTGKGAQTSSEVIFYLGGMCQPGFCYYRESENGCYGGTQDTCRPGTRGQPDLRAFSGRAWGMKSGLHLTVIERPGN